MIRYSIKIIESQRKQSKDVIIIKNKLAEIYNNNDEDFIQKKYNYFVTIRNTMRRMSDKPVSDEDVLNEIKRRYKTPKQKGTRSNNQRWNKIIELLKSLYDIQNDEELRKKLTYFKTEKAKNPQKTDEEIIDLLKNRLEKTTSRKISDRAKYIRQRLTEIYNIDSEIELKRRMGLFYNKRNQMSNKLSNRTFYIPTDEEVLAELEKSLKTRKRTPGLRPGKKTDFERIDYIKNKLKEIFNTQDETIIETKFRTFIATKAKLKKSNPQITDEQTLEFIREKSQQPRPTRQRTEKTIELLKELSDIYNTEDPFILETKKHLFYITRDRINTDRTLKSLPPMEDSEILDIMRERQQKLAKTDIQKLIKIAQNFEYHNNYEKSDKILKIIDILLK